MQSVLAYNARNPEVIALPFKRKAFKETTDLAKNQILQQASTAMLAQANASKQNVLSLLQG